MVQKVRILSSNELYDNANDGSRVYAIEANVHIASSKANSMDSGKVLKNDEEIAQFSWWSEDNLNITYQGVSVSERNDINIAVDTFINEVKNAVKE